MSKELPIPEEILSAENGVHGDVDKFLEYVESGQAKLEYDAMVRNHQEALVQWMRDQTGWAYEGRAYQHGINS